MQQKQETERLQQQLLAQSQQQQLASSLNQSQLGSQFQQMHNAQMGVAMQPTYMPCYVVQQPAPVPPPGAYAAPHMYPEGILPYQMHTVYVTLALIRICT